MGHSVCQSNTLYILNVHTMVCPESCEGGGTLASASQHIISRREALSVPIIATKTPNIRKTLWIQELNLNLFVTEFGTVTTTAVVDMPLWRQQGLDSKRRFHLRLSSFSLVSQIISRG